MEDIVVAKKKKRLFKKLNIKKYTVQALEQRGLSTNELRKLYSELRSISLKRRNALIAKGYKDVQEARLSVRKLKDMGGVPDVEYYIKAKIYEMAQYLNNPLTLLSNQSKRAELKAQQTLRDHGFAIAATRYTSFGKFMEALKARGGGLMLDSFRAVKYFEKEALNKTSLKDMVEDFNQWQQAEIKTIVENTKAVYPNQYREKLKEYEIDYEKYLRGEYSRGIQMDAKATKSASKKRKKGK